MGCERDMLLLLYVHICLKNHFINEKYTSEEVFCLHFFRLLLPLTIASSCNLFHMCLYKNLGSGVNFLDVIFGLNLIIIKVILEAYLRELNKQHQAAANNT